jgi:hypothetical protein
MSIQVRLPFALSFCSMPGAPPLQFSGHIAPFVFRRCARCYRRGKAAPFPLITVSDVCKRDMRTWLLTGAEPVFENLSRSRRDLQGDS